jgi:hypothetical protein
MGHGCQRIAVIPTADEFAECICLKILDVRTEERSPSTSMLRAFCFVVGAGGSCISMGFGLRLVALARVGVVSEDPAAA